MEDRNAKLIEKILFTEAIHGFSTTHFIDLFDFLS